MASLKLPSVADLDSTYACDDKPYIFENPDDLPVETLINHILPLPQEHCSRSVRVPGTSQPGYSEIFRNGAFPNGLKSSIVPQLNTYHEIFKSGVERHSTATCLAFHEYDYENEQHLERYNTITYAEVNKRKTNLGDGLLFLLNNNNFLDASLASHQKIINHERDYQKYDKDDFSFIATFYSGNRVEWIISDLACSSNTITSTALYDTLGPGASVFILESTESPVVISSKSKIQQLINLKRDNPDKLKNLIMLVSMDPLAPKDGHLFKQAESSGIKIYDFKQVEGVGAVFPRKGTPPNPDSVFTITFTSGTTGANPKGVVLTQRSVATAISTATVLLPHSSKSKEFAFLPLAHIFERQMSAANFIYGGSVALPRLGGTPLTLFQDLKLWKPTILANVPRIFSKIEATLKQITKNADPTQFDGATRKKLRAAIGFDEIERCFTGGAPIAADTVRYLKDALGMGFTQV
ncbi:uncharacterized protein LODBEIA_P59440 [Lodderomyces beijingensis]|uniref:AMP-dependent synthetase/ligase domain-containing protein n=1 Tax=Lodderomyces beijingensis TaxID=1775926 RepID=A0ABP0ZVZ8_9ASCO